MTTTTGTVTTTTDPGAAPCTGTLIGMGDARTTPRKPHLHFADRPLWQRVAIIVVSLIVVFGVPMAIAMVAGAVVGATWVLQRLPELPAPSGLVDN